MKNLSKSQETMITQQKTLIDFSHHQNYYKLIGIDLLRQRNTSILQQINLMRKIEEDYGVTIFVIAEKQ